MKSNITKIAVALAVPLTLASALALAGKPTDNPGKKSDKNPNGQETLVHPEMNKSSHVQKHPLGVRQQALRARAKEAQLNGNAYGKTHEVARGQFVELERTGEDSIWTLLAEFGDLSHNAIAQPDRSIDNSTIWTADFSQEYFMDLLFNEAPGANSMRNYYIEQSSNRYTVNGGVTGWVTAPSSAATYDDDYWDGGDNGVWKLINDSVTAWADSKISAGMTDAEIAAEMAQYDVWDRYDHDGDGNFDEPDGYIDHFQIVHAGMGEEAGGGVLGGSAIWSHRWYARFGGIEVNGPEGNLLGGIEVPGTGLWIGDYTVEPENGGVGVFAHEFAHDHGLPDLYDTGGGANSTGFWTLMSSGSWLNNGGEDIGSMPGHMGGWEKFQLGWYNYEVAFAGEHSVHKLGPAETNTKQAQGVFVVLPAKAVVTEIAEPFDGNFFYSGSGDDLDNFMYKSFSLTGSSSMTAMVNYDIEVDYDYAYVVVSTNGGANWVTVPTDQSTSVAQFGNGIMGITDGWEPMTADLSGYSGDVLVGFRYWTDGGLALPGFMADNVQIDGGAVSTGDGDEGWVFEGFRTSSGTESGMYSNYYLAEYRTYMGYDANLQLGPYNFGFLDQRGDWVERFPYQDGLLVSYWDTSFNDNNVSAHPGGGLILPVDAHSEVTYSADGQPWRPRIQSFDSPFSMDPTDEVTLHKNSVGMTIPSQPANSTFNDLYDYWTAANGWAGVAVPKTGTQIDITSMSALDNFMQIEISPSN